MVLLMAAHAGLLPEIEIVEFSKHLALEGGNWHTFSSSIVDAKSQRGWHCPAAKEYALPVSKSIRGGSPKRVLGCNNK